MEPQIDKNVVEVVMPKSGRFCRIDPITLGAVVFASVDEKHFMTRMFHVLCTVDNEKLSLDEWHKMDMEDCMPVYGEIHRMMHKCAATLPPGFRYDRR
jgi:hypothetical protein